MIYDLFLKRLIISHFTRKTFASLTSCRPLRNGTS